MKNNANVLSGIRQNEKKGLIKNKNKNKIEEEKRLKIGK
jgi:hypothetical protein